jgi:hypothetical protein
MRFYFQALLQGGGGGRISWYIIWKFSLNAMYYVLKNYIFKSLLLPLLKKRDRLLIFSRQYLVDLLQYD